MSGRKVFTAGEVLQAADVNDYLMDQSVMVFAGTAARGSAIPSPTEGMVTYRSDDDVVEVYNGSSFVPVGPGQILQVVQAFKSDTFSTSSTSYVDITGLSATITPSATSSKILIGYQLQGNARSGTVGGFFKLLRDSTDISIADAAGSRDRTSGAMLGVQDEILFTGGFFLDSPSTTSAITYKVQMRANVAQTVYVNRAHGDTDAATTPRGVSSITLMEVAG